MQSTGSERLDFVSEQVWGRGLADGSVRVESGSAEVLGWETREDYWVVPSAASAQLLVPRDRTVAARALADYAGLRGPKVRIARRALAAAVSAGLPLSASRFRVLARPGASLATVHEIGRQVGSADVYATFGVRTAANAKPTLELRTPDGDAVGFVKMAWNDVTSAAVANEASAMTSMIADSRADIRMPGVLAEGLLGTLPFVMVEPLPRGIRHVPATRASLSDAEALGPAGIGDVRPIGESEQARTTIAALEVKTSHTPESLIIATRALARTVVEQNCPVRMAAFWHGDFSWWNTGRDPNGRLWLFDWETAQRDAPAGMDTLHWYAHLEDAENPLTLVSRATASLQHSRRLLRALGQSPAGVRAVAAWYAVTLVSNEIRLAESLGSWTRVKHSPEILDRMLRWGQAQLG